MHFKNFSVVIIAITIVSTTSFISCSKSESTSSTDCDDLKSAADKAVIRYNQAHTKASCDSAREALKEAGDCDDSYKNEYEAFGTCP